MSSRPPRPKPAQPVEAGSGRRSPHSENISSARRRPFPALTSCFSSDKIRFLTWGRTFTLLAPALLNRCNVAELAQPNESVLADDAATNTPHVMVVDDDPAMC